MSRVIIRLEKETHLWIPLHSNTLYIAFWAKEEEGHLARTDENVQIYAIIRPMTLTPYTPKNAC